MADTQDKSKGKKPDKAERAPKPEVLVRGLGSTYEIMNTNIKRWSVGSPIQAPLDGLLDLIRERAPVNKGAHV